MIKVFKRLFVFCLIYLGCSLAPSIVSAANPTFGPQTPANYATSTVGSPINASVSSTAAMGAEHSLTFDWNRKLIGWWRYNSDGDMTDYSGTGNTLTNNGAIWNASGKFGGAYDFDAVTDYLSITSSTYNLSSSDPYTISVWVKPSGTSNRTVLNLGTDGGAGSYMGFMNAGAGQTVEYTMRQNYSGNWLGVTSVATISSSTWNHIVVTNDRTNLRIYINGALSNTQALGAFGGYTAVFNLFIGKNLWGDYFNGSIDDVQFYKRALAGAEVSSLYNAQNTEYVSSFTPSVSGTYLYQAYAQNVSGNVSSTEQRTLYAGVTPPTRTLTYSAGSDGTISGSSSQIIAIGQNGSSVSAVPNNHFSFSDWSDGSLDNPRMDTGVASNVSVTANFVSSTYRLIYIAGNGGTLTGSTTQDIAYNMSGVSVTAIPDTGYAFSEWSDGVATESRTDANISASTTYTANFVQTGGGGAATALPVSVPLVITPPTVINGSIYGNVSNVFQMAISYSEDFAGTSWELYSESYKTILKPFYIKFRSPDGGVSDVFRINPVVQPSAQVKMNEALNIKTPVISKSSFTRNLRKGMTGKDIKDLQIFLNNRGFSVSIAGIGSKGKETMYFGSSTQRAVMAFQKANHLPPTGYFGPMTRVLISEL